MPPASWEAYATLTKEFGMPWLNGPDLFGEVIPAPLKAARATQIASLIGQAA